MFVQVIQGRISDAAQVRAALDRWAAELAPGAEGWLGTTAGVTDDGEFIALVRFESEEAARRNSDRPEQDRWWAETAKLFTGEAVFHDCRRAELRRGGGSDDAGFVQVIQGRVQDVARARQLMDRMDAVGATFRPDIIGGVLAEHGDGGFTNAIYFTSEREAREGERKPLPQEVAAVRDEMFALAGEPPRYFDLRQPWLYSPR